MKHPPGRNGSGGLISLLDIMNPFYSELIFQLGSDLALVGRESQPLQGRVDHRRQAPDLLKTLREAKRHCQKMGLVFSILTIDRIIDGLAAKELDWKEIDGLADELHSRLTDELCTTLFMQIPKNHAELYLYPFAKWGDVPARFPSATVNIEEAGKCLACNRGTACVYHLMRVMESGLNATSSALGIPYAPSWESHLKQINDRIAVKHKKKGVHWKRDEPFFRDVAAHLGAVKVAWRNPTMHIVRDYTPEMAEDVLNAVSGFMRQLATRLSEAPPKRRRSRALSVNVAEEITVIDHAKTVGR